MSRIPLSTIADRCRTLSVNQLLLFTTLFIVLLANQSLWGSLWVAVGDQPMAHIGFMMAFVILVATLTLILLAFFSLPGLVKPMLILLLMTSAATAYFIDNMHVMFSVSMIDNIFETDTREAGELISSGLIVHLLVFGVLPSIFVSSVRLKKETPIKEAFSRVKLLAVMVLVAVLAVFWSYKDFSLVLRANRSIRYLVNPVAPVVSLVKFVKLRTVGVDRSLEAVFSDASRFVPVSEDGRHTLLVIVVGETARAMNFSLDGYPRDTNPELSKYPLVNFTNTRSCGTATAESVPCMFSDLDHDHFNTQSARHRENLLDGLSRVGFNVLWRDNNSSCKGVCSRVAYESLLDLKVPGLCEHGECYDEILLHGIDDYLDGLDGDAVIVLHQKGSHGPAYYKRYPQKFSRFKPECDQSDVQNCDRQSITNTYDNTILYSDYVLSRVIDRLREYDKRFDTAMIYMSDHGESLGENGIYLHGLPYMFAPEEQTHVPFVIWLSENIRREKNIDLQCLQDHPNEQTSHDNLVHSVLGLLDVKTHVYQQKLDLFSTCRSHLMAKKEGGLMYGVDQQSSSWN
jgi:lipid A ethanolaminephosphotransferase